MSPKDIITVKCFQPFIINTIFIVISSSLQSCFRGAWTVKENSSTTQRRVKIMKSFKLLKNCKWHVAAVLPSALWCLDHFWRLKSHVFVCFFYSHRSPVFASILFLTSIFVTSFFPRWLKAEQSLPYYTGYRNNNKNPTPPPLVLLDHRRVPSLFRLKRKLKIEPCFCPCATRRRFPCKSPAEPRSASLRVLPHR